ncbi:MAG: cytidine deaminase [Planctomycetota bacterium]
MEDGLQALIDAARSVCGEFALAEDFTAGAVGAAILTESGRVYTGICLDLVCGIGFCAEASAAAAMLKDRETRVKAVVAVSAKRIVPPCGRCREMLLQINAANADALVIIASDRAIPLRDLLPHHWLPKP